MRFSRTNMLISSWPAAAFVKENRRQTAEFSITSFCWRNAGLKKSRTYTRHDAEIRPELFNLSLVCCRETIRAVLHRRKLSWKKAKKLLGRADPKRRQAFIEQLQSVLAGAQRDRHLLVYVDEAHLHQDADLGYGWAKRGERLWVASRSPGLSARVSFYGLYLYNEGQVRLWPFPRANGEHTIDVLR